MIWHKGFHEPAPIFLRQAQVFLAHFAQDLISSNPAQNGLKKPELASEKLALAHHRRFFS
jgi:hypothetical protein